jgi:hypothetical protein
MVKVLSKGDMLSVRGGNGTKPHKRVYFLPSNLWRSFRFFFMIIIMPSYALLA